MIIPLKNKSIPQCFGWPFRFLKSKTFENDEASEILWTSCNTMSSWDESSWSHHWDPAYRIMISICQVPIPSVPQTKSNNVANCRRCVLDISIDHHDCAFDVIRIVATYGGMLWYIHIIICYWRKKSSAAIWNLNKK